MLQTNREFVKFRIVNSFFPSAKRKLHQLRRETSIPVYQDSLHRRIWKKLRGSNNDIILYDRCGRQTFRFNQSQAPVSTLNVHKGICMSYYFNLCNCMLGNLFNYQQTSKFRA
uniref:Selenoprotein P N-terminal domain-containing protein n=1 Tax=Octopus bimaculoides TaxID=37653 RepID=A0A0L8G0Z9_OCTBM